MIKDGGTSTVQLICPRCGQKVWVTKVVGKPAVIPPHNIGARTALRMINEGKSTQKSFTCV